MEENKKKKTHLYGKCKLRKAISTRKAPIKNSNNHKKNIIQKRDFYANCKSIYYIPSTNFISIEIAPILTMKIIKEKQQLSIRTKRCANQTPPNANNSIAIRITLTCKINRNQKKTKQIHHTIPIDIQKEIQRNPNS